MTVRPGEAGDGSVEVLGVGRDVDPLGRQPSAPLPAARLPRLVEHRPEAGEDLLVGAEARVVPRKGPGVEAGVGVPEQHRVVAGVAGQQGDVGEPGVERGAVVHRPVVVQVGARVEARPRRPARRGIGPVVGEQRALRGQTVEGRRGEHRMAEGRQTVTPPLVHGDEQDVAGHPGDSCSELNRLKPMILPSAIPTVSLAKYGIVEKPLIGDVRVGVG